MENLPTVEGLTPTLLWYTLAGVVGLAALFLLAVKVGDAIRGIVQRRRLAQQPTDTLADAIGEKVLEKLEPRFEEIDRKLGADKIRLDDHAAKLAGLAATAESQQARVRAIEDGNRVLCRGILALLSHEINGNSIEKLNESKDEITNYLIEK